MLISKTIKALTPRLTPVLSDAGLQGAAELGILEAITTGSAGLARDADGAPSVVDLLDFTAYLRPFTPGIQAGLYLTPELLPLFGREARAINHAANDIRRRMSRAIKDHGDIERYITGTATKKLRLAAEIDTENTAKNVPTSFLEATLDENGHAPSFGVLGHADAAPFVESLELLAQEFADVIGLGDHDKGYSLAYWRHNLTPGLQAYDPRWDGNWLVAEVEMTSGATGDSILKQAQAQGLAAGE